MTQQKLISMALLAVTFGFVLSCQTDSSTFPVRPATLAYPVLAVPQPSPIPAAPVVTPSNAAPISLPLSTTSQIAPMAAQTGRGVRQPRPTLSPAASQPTDHGLYGICFSPYRDNQNPDDGVYPTISEIEEELRFIKDSGLALRIRTYSCMGTLFNIPELCRDMGLECWPGAWLSRYHGATEREVRALIAIGRKKLPNIPVLIVGNEVLLRNDLSEHDLIETIKRVKRETGLPVAYADVGGMWDLHPEVSRYVDVIVVHLYPYWDGHAIDGAVDALVEQWRKLSSKNPGKRIVIGETGWPLAGEINGIGASYSSIVKSTTGNTPGDTQGAAVPSPENQARYLREFLQASQANHLEYFYFSLFCENWKTKQEGIRGAKWGLFYANGTMNPSLGNMLPAKSRAGVKRSPGKIPPALPLPLPAFIYHDGEADANRFFPTNYMGDVNDIQVDEHCMNQPHSGKECLRIIYAAKGSNEWAGIYWIGPYMNHWGEYPGYVVKGCKKLVFWARGEKGGEIVEFKIGGLKAPGMPFHDSFGPLPGVGASHQLTQTWTQYSIDLDGVDTSALLGGFCLAVNKPGNPNGCTFYLDDIVLIGS